MKLRVATGIVVSAVSLLFGGDWAGQAGELWKRIAGHPESISDGTAMAWVSLAEATVQQVIAPVAGGPIIGLIPIVAVAGVVIGYASGRIIYALQFAMAAGLHSVASWAREAPLLVPSVPNSVFTADSRVRPKALLLLLALGNATSVIGFMLAIYIGRSRFLGMALIFLFTLFVLDLVVLSQSGQVGSGAKWVGTTLYSGSQLSNSGSIDTSAPTRVVRDRRLAVSALLLSIAVLATLGPGLVYFSLISVFVTSLVLHVALATREGAPIGFSLLLLVIGAGFVLLAQTLTVPYYARTLDTLFHTTLARRIANVGTLAPKAGTRYSELPVYHTLAAVYIQVLGGTARTVTALLVAGLFSVATAACYLIVRNVTGSLTTGFVAAALLAVNPEFINWGVQSHVQSLSLFFMTIFLVLHTSRSHSFRFTGLAAGVALVWAMTHHLSLFMAVVLIGLWNLAGTLWLLLNGYTDSQRLRTQLYQYSMLTMFVAVHWLLTGIYRVPIRWITKTSIQAQEGVGTTTVLIQTYDSTAQLIAASFPFVINNLHYAFFLAIGGYGLWSVVHKDGGMPSPTFPKVIVGFLFAVLLYVPNPAWLLGRGVGALNRWGMMTLPLLLPIVGLGVVRLFHNRKSSVKPVVLAVLVLTTAFLSVGAGFSNPSLADAVGQEKGATKYYTEGNLNAADHILVRTTDTTVYASHTFNGYILHEGWTGTSIAPPERFEPFRVVDGQIEAGAGLTVIEEGTLREDRVRMRVQVSEENEYQGGLDVIKPVSGSEVDIRREQQSVVYDNTDSVILFQEGEEN